ncbi:MAG TPA: DUF4349 domain-containing protein [Ignavibacteria bacterium]|nr:DUF4349 domain-containing protein [Ignavibacteria bacterium]
MKTKILLLAFVIFSSGILLGCNKKSNDTGNNPPPQLRLLEDESAPKFKIDNSEPVSKNMDALQIKNQSRTSTSIQIQDRMVVKSGQIQIEADNYDGILNEIIKLTGEYKGFVNNSTSSLTPASKKQGSINVRIPAASFDEFVRKITGLGKVMSENISSRDITDEFIDVQARLNTQKELEKRLLDLLNSKAGNLSDVIDVEDKLSDVRSKIESAEGKINFLKNQAEYSTLQINIFEPSILNTSSGGGFFYEIGQSISKGLTGFTEVTGGLIAGLIAFTPVIIFFVILFFILRRLWRKRKLNKVAIQTS